MEDADLVLMLGTDFPYRSWLSEEARVIQVDRRAEALGRRSPAALGVHADLAVFLDRALADLPDRPGPPEPHRARLAAEAWSRAMAHLERPDRSDAIHPQAAAAALGRLACEDAVFTCDTGSVTVWAARHLRLRPGQRITFCANLGSMAYAMPAAIGSQLAAPGRQVISLSGDGGFNMLMGEFLTAVRYQLPIKVVVFDNGQAGLIQMEQESEGYPEFATGQANPDYAALARALGGKGFAVSRPEELDEVLAAGLTAEGPALIAVRVAEDELALPPKVTLSQAWGFGLAKAKEPFD
jgi:thiamine pyrophosphate-dependent acetolactate synthase large subunit-like protein